MPYKDLERKRQWEREHREQRNARRRELKVQALVSPKAGLDPHAKDQPASGWRVLAGLAIGWELLCSQQSLGQVCLPWAVLNRLVPRATKYERFRLNILKPCLRL
jgi:hypothetical protein